jgi:hypothetical protein
MSEMRRVTLKTRRCPKCDREVSATFEEPLHDSTGRNVVFVEAHGCWKVAEDGTLQKPCEA